MTHEKIVQRDRNLLIVMVEGMGAYSDPKERELLAVKLRRAAGDRFDMRQGMTSYFGSTTGAASRELCGKWKTFAYYLSVESENCLPAQLAGAGYETMNYHAAYSALFSRDIWYPRIGFQTLNFREHIERKWPVDASRICGTVTAGLCDDDVARLLHNELKAPSPSRKFIYWLTLNSHLPFQPVENGPLNCGKSNSVIRSAMPCQLTEIWMQVFDGVARIAMDPDMPPVDILVVGDHNTPMWSRADFASFLPGKVDWYFLEDRRRNNKDGKVDQTASLR